MVLRVSALGPDTMSYQWIKDGKVITANSLPNITGANSATLHINEFCHEHNGQYFCVVSYESCILITDGAEIQGMHSICICDLFTL